MKEKSDKTFNFFFETFSNQFSAKNRHFLSNMNVIGIHFKSAANTFKKIQLVSNCCQIFTQFESFLRKNIAIIHCYSYTQNFRHRNTFHEYVYHEYAYHEYAYHEYVFDTNQVGTTL